MLSYASPRSSLRSKFSTSIVPSALALAFAGFAAIAVPRAAAAPAPSDQRVLFVMIDGLRWQEVFRGADEAYFDTPNGGIPEKELASYRTEFLAATAAERRRKLLPFFWSEIAARGQLFGNRDLGSEVRVANAEWFSYPGYNEILCGFPDPLIVSNAPIPNRNVTVLEWLHGRPGFDGRVAAAVTWHVLTATLNVGRSRLPVWVSSRNPTLAARSPRFAELDRLMLDVPIKARGEHYDGFTHHAAREMIAVFQPRVFYVSFGEPDTDAHRRRYDAYLESTRRADRFVRELWETLQSLEAYRGRTTLVVSPDHGRGRTPKDWISHNKTTPGSEETWLAVLGPQTRPLGERSAHAPLVSAQIAATLAALVGEDLIAAEPRAAAPVADVLSTP